LQRWYAEPNEACAAVSKTYARRNRGEIDMCLRVCTLAVSSTCFAIGYATGNLLRETACNGRASRYHFLLMNTALGYVLVFVGGGLGAAARHWVNRTALTLAGPDYPTGTLVVNITGSMAMGMLAAWFAFRGETTTAGERLFLTTGVLGGFTTFSAFALDARLMWERHDWVAALVYVGASVMLSILGLIAGIFIVRVPLS
jgi:CrcB protein